MEHRLEIQVRGYELDSFGHVNNSVYFNYFEAARWDYFEKSGLYRAMAEEDLFPIVIEQTCRYLKELINFDNIIIKSEWSSDGVFLYCSQKIFKENDCHAKAKAKLLLMNRNRDKKIPNEYILNRINLLNDKEER